MSLDFQPDGVTGVTEVQLNDGAVSCDTPGETPDVPEVATRLPNLEDRPCYRVFDDWVDEGGVKYRPGVWHFGIKPATEHKPPEPTQIWICSPLYVDALTTDGHGSNYGRLLRFRPTRGSWRTWAMPMELLRGDGVELRGELLHMGVEIDPRGRVHLAFYLQHRVPTKEVQCALQTGWARPAVFVLPDEVIGPQAAKVTYQSGDRGTDEYTVGGTLPGWRDGVAAMAVGNPLLMLALSAAFAGPLLSLCNAESGGIHFVGDSSTGKTTIVEAACSVWGGPNFKRSWRATSNGMEGIAALFNDSLLALDEISQCDPREVGQIVYALGNGVGKQRASRTGAARHVMRWRCSVISSGERTIGTTMAEGGHRVKAGQSMRLLDVPAQRKHGAWDDLHGLPSGAALSDALRNAAKTHYGQAGREFLRHLTRDRQINFGQELENMKSRPEFTPKTEDGQAKRAAARFSLLALAGEVATHYGLTGWATGAAIHAATEGFAAWQTLRGNRGNNLEREQIIERVGGFIERHGDSRFSKIDEQFPVTVRDRAGWWRDTNGSRFYLFTSDGMREALSGFDFQRALEVLQEVGAIGPANAEGKRTKVLRVAGTPMRLYEVKASVLTGS